MTGTTPTTRSWNLSAGSAMALPAFFIAVLALAGALIGGQHRVMFASFIGAAGAAAIWAVVLFVRAKVAGRTLTLVWHAKPQHWVQVIAQLMIYYWWGRHVPIVAAFTPFIVSQLFFAYAVDALLNWSRRDSYTFGFGPVPVILSINLFLWFRPDWFYWQFVMIALGFLGKELIRWQKDGRSAHIFNPSSFPLAVFSLVLIVMRGEDYTFGELIANTIFDPPHMYLLVFLAAVPGQFLFGVARMSLAALATMMAISLTYFQVTGTYLFLDAHVPVPVFIGMLLLVTDPSTSPKTEVGRLMFGAIYAVATTVLFLLLPLWGVPTFYDKLLPVPLMNLSVRAIDRLALSRPWAGLDPTRLWPTLTSRGRSFAYGTAMAVLFTALYATQGMGDRHPGQYLPFWTQACQAGSDRACRYEAHLTETYCNNGSGWACNEAGIRLAQVGRNPAAYFRRGCELGFPQACSAAGMDGVPGPPAHAPPRLEDLPVVLRGTKPVLAERDPDKLMALACSQGWTEICGRS